MKLTIDSSFGTARTGTVTTARGSFKIPCFMPVGTRGGVRAVSIDDVASAGFEVLLANTYHLMLRPGTETVESLGGIHGFTGWPGHVLTDSGGYQIFSLKARYDEKGVTFRSVYDGSSHCLTPEEAVRIQWSLGSDVQMVLDVCAALPASRGELEDAVELTLRWAERARRAFGALARGSGGEARSLFAIVQGGDDTTLRRRCARALVDMEVGIGADTGFAGFAVGGLSVGEPVESRREALAAALEELPSDRPRYLMGIGDPAGLLEAVAMGVDMFDCVLPTRLARHGTLLTSEGRWSLKQARFAGDPGPIDPSCRCPTCSRWSRGYLRHLFVVEDPAALRLATLHNLAWMEDLVRRARASIQAGTLADLVASTSALFPVN